MIISATIVSCRSNISASLWPFLRHVCLWPASLTSHCFNHGSILELRFLISESDQCFSEFYLMLGKCVNYYNDIFWGYTCFRIIRILERDWRHISVLQSSRITYVYEPVQTPYSVTTYLITVNIKMSNLLQIRILLYLPKSSRIICMLWVLKSLYVVEELESFVYLAKSSNILPKCRPKLNRSWAIRNNLNWPMITLLGYRPINVWWSVKGLREKRSAYIAWILFMPGKQIC